ncbi:hypothetical protein D3C80_1354250 [compost metagenome]
MDVLHPRKAAVEQAIAQRELSPLPAQGDHGGVIVQIEAPLQDLQRLTDRGHQEHDLANCTYLRNAGSIAEQQPQMLALHLIRCAGQ